MKIHGGFIDLVLLSNESNPENNEVHTHHLVSTWLQHYRNNVLRPFFVSSRGLCGETDGWQPEGRQLLSCSGIIISIVGA